MFVRHVGPGAPGAELSDRSYPGVPFPQSARRFRLPIVLVLFWHLPAYFAR